MAEPPVRYKTFDELSGDELLEIEQARRANRPAPKFERREYAKERRDVLKSHGLLDEGEVQDDGSPLDLESMSTDDHFQRIRRHH